MVVTEDNQFFSWGSNTGGQLDAPPELKNNAGNIAALTGGTDHGVALTNDGKVVNWGKSNKIENDPKNMIPVPDTLSQGVYTAIASGYHHSLALNSEGKIEAWGYNDNGQAKVPGDLTGKTVVAIAAAAWHSMALTTEGKVYAWGSNYDGQTTVPKEVKGEGTVTRMGTSYYAPYVETHTKMAPTLQVTRGLVSTGSDYSHEATVVLKDLATDKPIEKAVVNFSIANNDDLGASLTSERVVTDSSGVAKTRIIGKKPGEYTIEAHVGYIKAIKAEGYPITAKFSGTPTLGEISGATVKVGELVSLKVIAGGFPAPRVGVKTDTGTGGLLPKGLTLNPDTLLIEGNVEKTVSPGEYTFALVAKNELGETTRQYTITVQAADKPEPEEKPEDKIAAQIKGILAGQETERQKLDEVKKVLAETVGKLEGEEKAALLGKVQDLLKDDAAALKVVAEAQNAEEPKPEPEEKPEDKIAAQIKGILAGQETERQKLDEVKKVLAETVGKLEGEEKAALLGKVQDLLKDDAAALKVVAEAQNAEEPKPEPEEKPEDKIAAQIKGILAGQETERQKLDEVKKVLAETVGKLEGEEKAALLGKVQDLLKDDAAALKVVAEAQNAEEPKPEPEEKPEKEEPNVAGSNTETPKAAEQKGGAVTVPSDAQKAAEANAKGSPATLSKTGAHDPFLLVGAVLALLGVGVVLRLRGRASKSS
ncbi:putative Ig domain-containing protein [Lysinibacter sp. HNR]|uniref:putative Ig domain-containing protein n=1 Tax=Lysinibacter sp. HNR TaxID=3031408 RepID=UPI0024352E62|nr:putative Ig domain-containing protein [Lysinibacter sp. HNR]WGD37141.1 putative Ig domain-containing protein [Lysinibacter sp. HNR]